MKPKILLIILLVLIGLTMTTPIIAADMLHRLTHNDQYALVLGRVTTVAHSSFKLSVAKLISGHRVPSRIEIELTGTDRIRPGEKLLISLQRSGRRYKVHWGLFRVSSLDPKQLKIIKSPWPKGDLAALEHYIHTNGTEHDFFYVFSWAFVRYQDGSFTPIYSEMTVPQSAQHLKLMICPERQDYRLTDSTTPGIGLAALYFRQREAVQFCWETNYGEFVLWNPPDYQVISLGMTATVDQGPTVYWRPSLTPQAIPKEGIKITLTVKSSKSKIKYEQASIAIIAKEEGFRVKITVR
jgi:hypothetical protein